MLPLRGTQEAEEGLLGSRGGVKLWLRKPDQDSGQALSQGPVSALPSDWWEQPCWAELRSSGGGGCFWCLGLGFCPSATDLHQLWEVTGSVPFTVSEMFVWALRFGQVPSETGEQTGAAW